MPEFVDFAGPLPPRDGVVSSSQLRLASDRFHMRAGTLTPKVAAAIAQLRSGHLVKLVHQPNLFAYAKLLGQFVAAEQLAARVEGSSAIYGFIDYDVVDNQRFRQAMIPDLSSGQGFRRVSLPRNLTRHRTAISLRVAAPELEWSHETATSLAQAIQSYSAFPGAVAMGSTGLARLSADLDHAARNASNVADHNAILLSRFVNGWLGSAIPFVPMSTLWSNAASAIDALPSFLEIFKAVRAAATMLRSHDVELGRAENDHYLPWWAVCTCGSRVPLAKSGEGPACSHCGQRVRVSSFEANQDFSVQTVPRIIMHNLLNARGFGFQCGVSHLGSAEHIIQHSLALSLIGLPPLPQWLWQCAGSFNSLLEQDPTKAGNAAIALIEEGAAGYPYFVAGSRPEEFLGAIDLKIARATEDV